MSDRSYIPTSRNNNHQSNLLDNRELSPNTISPDTSCEDLLGLTTINSDLELPSLARTSTSNDDKAAVNISRNDDAQRQAPSPSSSPPPTPTPIPTRSPRSPRSHPSLTTYTSHYTIPFDKPTLAPPPIHPSAVPGAPADPYMTKVKPNTNIMYGNGTLSPLPKFSKIGHSGYVSARLSTASLILKKWKRVFWVTYNDETELLVFRSKSDFDEWATNPYMSPNQRNDLVKLRVNLKKGGSGNLGVKCYRVTPLHSKEYGKMGKMCHFKLEQWMHHGPVTLGAFASNSKPEVGSFQVILNAIIERQGYGVKHLVSSEDRHDIADNILKSILTPNSTSTRD